MAFSRVAAAPRSTRAAASACPANTAASTQSAAYQECQPPASQAAPHGAVVDVGAQPLERGVRLIAIQRDQGVEGRCPPARAGREAPRIGRQGDRDLDPSVAACLVAEQTMHHRQGIGGHVEGARDRTAGTLPGREKPIAARDSGLEVAGQRIDLDATCERRVRIVAITSEFSRAGRRSRPQSAADRLPAAPPTPSTDSR